MYSKLFPGMFTGSMMGSGAAVFAVMTYAIANADEKGMVELNPQLLAAVIGESKELIELAIESLMKPDYKSRSPEEKGKRIIKEGQFLYRLVNYQKYRSIRDEEARLEYQRDWDHKHRPSGHRRHSPTQSDTVRPVRQSPTQADTDTDTDTDTEETTNTGCAVQSAQAMGTEKKRAVLNPKVERLSVSKKTALFSSFWEAYPKKVGKAPALKAFLKLDVSRAMVDRMVAAIEEQAQSRQWREKNGEYIPHPEKWLNDARWEDEGTSLPDQEPEFVPPTQEQLDYLDALDAEKAKANAKPKL